MRAQRAEPEMGSQTRKVDDSRQSLRSGRVPARQSQTIPGRKRHDLHPWYAPELGIEEKRRRHVKNFTLQRVNREEDQKAEGDGAFDELGP